MAKVNESNLARMLQELDTALPVRVEEHIARPARLALERMLTACS
jgi:quinolinate synthase